MNKIIYFSYASLAFVFIIAIVYFRKKKVNTIEIKLFTNILLLTIACLIFEFYSMVKDIFEKIIFDINGFISCKLFEIYYNFN